MRLIVLQAYSTPQRRCPLAQIPQSTLAVGGGDTDPVVAHPHRHFIAGDCQFDLDARRVGVPGDVGQGLSDRCQDLWPHVRRYDTVDGAATGELGREAEGGGVFVDDGLNVGAEGTTARLVVEFEDGSAKVTDGGVDVFDRSADPLLYGGLHHPVHALKL